MKLPELLKSAELPTVDFAQFLRKNLRRNMPPLDVSRLRIEALIHQQRNALKTPTTGDASLVIKYKNQEGAVLSLAELEDGEVWDILQVQGAKSRKSYRLASSLLWPNALASRTKEYAMEPSAEVRHLVMGATWGMKNIDGATSEHIFETYAAVRHILGMQYSEELGKFIKDI